MASSISKSSPPSWIEMGLLPSRKKQPMARLNEYTDPFNERIGQVKDRCLAYWNNPTRERRSVYFASLSELAQRPHGDAFDTDVYIYEAERVFRGDTFQSFPASRNRLIFPATQYLNSLRSFESELLKSPIQRKTLEENLNQVVRAHLSFVQAFIPEFNHAAALTSPAIAMNYPKTIELFYNSFLEEMVSLDKDSFQQWRQWTLENDETVLQLFPKIGIFKLLCQNSSVELTKGCDSQFSSLRRDLSRLSKEETILLFRRLKGEPIKGEPALYKAISDFALRIQRGERAPIFNGIAKILFSEWSKSFAILEGWKPNRVLSRKEALAEILKKWGAQETLTVEMLPRDFYIPECRKAIFDLREAIQKRKSDKTIEEMTEKTAELLLSHCRFLKPELLARIALNF